MANPFTETINSSLLFSQSSFNAALVLPPFAGMSIMGWENFGMASEPVLDLFRSPSIKYLIKGGVVDL